MLLTASPASSKLVGLRMTTLHEEPTHRTLAEEPEDSYSDPEYDDFEKPSQSNSFLRNNRSKMVGSKTMDSFMDYSGNTSGMNLSYTSNVNSTLKHLTGNATPSMSSSTSSGYGSQVLDGSTKKKTVLNSCSFSYRLFHAVILPTMTSSQ